MKTIYMYANNMEIEVPIAMLEMIPQQGQADSQTLSAYELYKAVFDDMDNQWFIEYLSDFGAWDESELQDRALNIQRTIWLLSGDYYEELYNNE